MHFGHGLVEGSEQEHHVEPALVDESLVGNRDGCEVRQFRLRQLLIGVFIGCQGQGLLLDAQVLLVLSQELGFHHRLHELLPDEWGEEGVFFVVGDVGCFLESSHHR